MIELPDAVARRLVFLLPYVNAQMESADNFQMMQDAQAIRGLLEIQLREAKREEER